MAQGLLLDKTNVLEVRVEDDYYRVSYGFHEFSSFRKDDAAAKRVIVVQLMNMEVNKSEISRVFDVHRSSLYFWQETYEEGGITALVNLQKGPESKLTEAVKDYIYALYKNLRGWRKFRNKIAEEVKKLYGVEVSREAIRRAVKERKEREELRGVSEGAETVHGAEAERSAEKPGVVKHGGALIALPLLQSYRVEEVLVDGVSSRGGRYGFKECVLSLLLLLGARLLKVEENIKHYDDEMMGGLIGRRRLPSLKTVRRVMAEAGEEIERGVEGMKTAYALKCLDVWGYEGAFYIDGHFMPYTGGESILYGYNPQRRLAERGRTAYVVNTASGRPIYEVLSDGFDDFRVNIEKIVDFLIEEAAVERPVVIFDRGGFGWESFQRIEGKADFICWYEGKVAIPQAGKWREVEVPHAGNTYGEPEYVSRQWKEQVIEPGDESGRGYRRIVFLRKGRKVSPAITNMKEASGEEVLLMLTRRWGAQENVFKELVIDGLDKIHSYGKDEYEREYFEREGIDENRMMENPAYRKLQEEKRKLQNKRNLTLGRIAQREKESGKTVKPTKQQKERLDGIEKRLEEIVERLEYLPKEIPRIDYIKDNGLMRLSNEKKKYFDLLNLVAYNLRQDMVEIAGPIYRNNRDVHQLVLKILRLMTTIEYGGEQTQVIFVQRLKGQEGEALREICRHANSVGHQTELFPGKLTFSVG